MEVGAEKETYETRSAVEAKRVTERVNYGMHY